MRFAAAARSFFDLMSAPAASAGLKLMSSVRVLKFSQNFMICKCNNGWHVATRKQVSVLAT